MVTNATSNAVIALVRVGLTRLGAGLSGVVALPAAMGYLSS